MQQITDAYILGIKEGRSMLTAYPDIDPQGEVEMFTELMRSHSQPMKDVFKGQRDFWKNQIKKG